MISFRREPTLGFRVFINGNPTKLSYYREIIKDRSEFIVCYDPTPIRIQNFIFLPSDQITVLANFNQDHKARQYIKNIIKDSTESHIKSFYWWES